MPSEIVCQVKKQHAEQGRKGKEALEHSVEPEDRQQMTPQYSHGVHWYHMIGGHVQTRFIGFCLLVKSIIIKVHMNRKLTRKYHSTFSLKVHLQDTVCPTQPAP